MAEKITFLDVGAHRGETLQEVLNPRYKFDVVHAFEPMPQPFAFLQKNFNPRPPLSLHLHPFGLADFTGQSDIYGEAMGASIFRSKTDIDPTIETRCAFIRASEFFSEHLSEEDLVVMKLNCEGAEIPILRDLLDSGEIRKITHVMIDFDALKIPDLGEDAVRAILGRFEEEGFENFSSANQVMLGKKHQKRIRYWLAGLSCAKKIMNWQRLLPTFNYAILKRLLFQYSPITEVKKS